MMNYKAGWLTAIREWSHSISERFLTKRHRLGKLHAPRLLRLMLNRKLNSLIKFDGIKTMTTQRLTLPFLPRREVGGGFNFFFLFFLTERLNRKERKCEEKDYAAHELKIERSRMNKKKPAQVSLVQVGIIASTKKVNGSMYLKIVLGGLSNEPGIGDLQLAFSRVRS